MTLYFMTKLSTIIIIIIQSVHYTLVITMIIIILIEQLINCFINFVRVLIKLQACMYN